MTYEGLRLSNNDTAPRYFGLAVQNMYQKLNTGQESRYA